MTTFGNLLAFSPELWLLLGAVVVFIIARFTNARTTTTAALIALAIAFIGLATQFKSTITILDGAFLLDGFAIVADVIIVVVAALALLMSRGDIVPGEVEFTAGPGFVLLATLGAMLAVSSAEMIALFLSLELVAINLYLMAALRRRGPRSIAAALGYLTLGAAGSGLLLYGLAIIFGLTGQTQLRAAGVALEDVNPNQAAVLLAVSLLIAGFAVRLGVLPMRWWVRGFESGVAPRALIFIESVGVVTSLAVLGRLLSMTFASTRIPYAPLLAGVAAVVMTTGNLLMLVQASVRRMLVYSLIAQVGFALVAFTDLKRVGITALLVFVTALALTTLALFGSLIAYTRLVHSDTLYDLSGMARYSPGLALAFLISLLSLAGLPPVAGFLGKLLLLQAAVDGGYTWLAVIGAANIVIAALAYLRVARIVFADPPLFEVPPVHLDVGLRAALGLVCLGLVFMGALMVPLSSAAAYGRAALIH